MAAALQLRLELNSARFTKALNTVVRLTKKDQRTIFWQQARLLMIDLLNATPPRKRRVAEAKPNGRFGNVSFAEQRRRGNQAVKRDIEKAFIDAQFLIDQTTESRWVAVASQALKNNDRETLQVLIDRSNYRFRGFMVIHEANEEFLDRVRNKRGRVKRSFRPYLVIKRESIAKLIKLKQSHVGEAMHGWLRGVDLVMAFRGNHPQIKVPNLSPPKWITRHQASKGKAKPINQSDKVWGIIVTNTAKHAQRMGFAEVVPWAIGNRARQMIRQMRKWRDRRHRQHSAK